MPYIEEAILKAVGESELSERQISIAAVGHESAIRSLKRGVSPNAATVAALCSTLGLEVYVGPPRNQAPPTDSAKAPQVADPDRQPPPNAPAQLMPSAVDVQPLPVMMAPGSAGFSPTGCAYFGGDFLEGFQLYPHRCQVVSQFNDDMWPPLERGCNLLADRRRQELRPGLIYAIKYGGEVLVRRAQHGRGGWSFVASKESLPPVAAAHAEIVGQIVWSAKLHGLGIDAADAYKMMMAGG